MICFLFFAPLCCFADTVASPLVLFSFNYCVASNDVKYNSHLKFQLFVRIFMKAKAHCCSYVDIVLAV